MLDDLALHGLAVGLGTSLFMLVLHFVRRRVSKREVKYEGESFIVPGLPLLPGYSRLLEIDAMNNKAQAVCKALGGEVNHWRTKIRVGLRDDVEWWSDLPPQWRGAPARPKPTSVPSSGSKTSH